MTDKMNREEIEELLNEELPYWSEETDQRKALVYALKLVHKDEINDGFLGMVVETLVKKKRLTLPYSELTNEEIELALYKEIPNWSPDSVEEWAIMVALDLIHADENNKSRVEELMKALRKRRRA